MMLPKILIVSPAAAKAHEANGDLGQAWLAEHTAGTGPYMAESWERGVQHTLTRFDSYWRGWSGQHFDKVVNRVVKEVPSHRMMLERGDTDIASSYNLDDFDALKQNKDVVIDSAPSLTSLDFIMAQHRPPMSDVRLRRALRAMFDYDGFLSTVMKGYARPLRQPWSTGLPFSDPSLPAPKQDLATAKDLLAQAGFANGGLKLSMTATAGYIERAQAAQILQATAKTLGVEISFEAMPVAPWYALLENPDTTSDLYIIGAYPSYPDPDAVVFQQYHSSSARKGSFNFGQYKSQKADQLMVDGRTTLDPAKRAPIYKELRQTLEDDATAIHIMEQDFVMLRRASLKGYKFTPAFFEVYFPYYMYTE
jgi:peptide/nickel transport system substrate-binding protein